MGRNFILTESQVKRLVENLDEEAAGYDDFDTMLNHGGKSMGILVDTMTDLSKVFRGITSMLRSENIEYIDYLLSSEVIKKQGYFDPVIIQKLKQKYQQNNFRLNLPFDLDLLIIPLSLGIFLEQFNL